LEVTSKNKISFSNILTVVYFFASINSLLTIKPNKYISSDSFHRSNSSGDKVTAYSLSKLERTREAHKKRRSFSFIEENDGMRMQVFV
jgi:hypothetical protein